ncbi:MAG: hypothetical protein V4570_04440 [Pseudomonadota bacterium]
MVDESNENYLETLNDELSLALGQAIWTFAKAEAITYEYINALSKDNLNELLGRQTFNARVDLVLKLILRIENLDNEKTKAQAAINKLKSLINRRNMIAHNPWLIWVDLEQEVFMTEIHDASKPMDKQNTDKTLNLEKIKQFTQETQEIVLELKQALTPLAEVVRGF